jgi:DNA invertase Pin-like site-specific DNA recombinase
MKRVRCAIYTRKSSEEGLEQDFNSLDAQREACAAYVLSQASEGWTLLPDRYDDGGISGGTLERPALRRLLADVADGRLDIIVVYKVDRLTRSLLDFSRLVEAFDAAGTSFVSVTQSFNTTTSMGRLTLNMLLSFAQFEREVTAERIRDKIAASKARGMWMGGTPPLGYKPDGRSLAIVEEHAAIIRDIFCRYLACGNVRLVAEQLVTENIRAPVRHRIGSGAAFGGVAFTRGQVHAFLKCPAYVSEIHHQGRVHTALHPPIIDRDTWDAVQRRLAEHVKGARRGPRTASTALLAGIIVDSAGEPLISAHACKGQVRYRYYVSRASHHAGSGTGPATGSSTASGLRVPATEIEAAVAQAVARALDDPLALAASLGLPIRPADIHGLAEGAAELSRLALKRDRDLLSDIIAQVRVLDSGIEVELAVPALAAQLGLAPDPDNTSASTLTLRTELRLTRTGRAVRFVQGDGLASPNTNTALISLVVKAHRWWDILQAGETDIKMLAAREKVSASWITRVLRLAFLSPAVTDALLAGRLRAGVDAAQLTATDAVPVSWAEQQRAMLPG